MSAFGMPDCAIASRTTGTIVSVSLCSWSSATAVDAYETTATSLIGHSTSPSVAALRSFSQVVLVVVVGCVGFARGLEPLDRRMVGLQLVGPLGLHAHAHVHVFHLAPAD